MQRQELEQYLADTFEYAKFDDHCKNGLQVEGKDLLHRIAFGVSFNLPLLHEAIKWQADALIVHHGIFGKEFFSLRGVLRDKVKLLLSHEMSLFGIHLPLDAHRELGNNAQLFGYIDGEIAEPYDVGFIGNNARAYPLETLLERFHHNLHPSQEDVITYITEGTSVLLPKQRYGFWYFPNGPAIPQKIGIISGGAARRYKDVIEKGVDTFICGEIAEPTPALSYETKTNFVNLGHYWSEKPGIWALQQAIQQRFDVTTRFIEIDNVI